MPFLPASIDMIQSGLGYSEQLSNFRTLSSTNPNQYGTIEGLLYTPTLSPAVAPVCAGFQADVPENATTLADFPQNQDYPLVAVFPWTTSSDCTEAYLAQARMDAVEAAITYHTGVGPQVVPDTTDAAWSLDDGGIWKSDNQYPIYAVSPAAGTELLAELALYNGNMTSAPNGDLLASQYDPDAFPRLFAHINLQGSGSVPSLWIFLIIVLAVLLGIVILASIVMHIIQRHQRKVLQRRLERGEVDLESLGIKKMNVPQEVIDKMPKYTFTTAPEVDPPVPAAAASRPGTTSKRVPTPPHQHETSFSQTTCPICLDDFSPNESEVRQLPCRHIFHPECIDLFLRDNSSLCPMCKVSALPQGYCPVKVTNLMVRRERLVRRMRERRRAGVAAAAARAAGDEPERPMNRATQTSLWLQRRLRVGAGIPTTPPPQTGSAAANTGTLSSLTGRTRSDHATTDVRSPNSSATEDVELGQIHPPESQSTPSRTDNPSRSTAAMPPEIATQGSAARRAWRRERLARQQDEAYVEQEATTRQVDVGRPMWRRVVGRIAPGFD